jgi:hypothetical protein
VVASPQEAFIKDKPDAETDEQSTRRNGARLSTYLHTVSLNLARDYLRFLLLYDVLNHMGIFSSGKSI